MKLNQYRDHILKSLMIEREKGYAISEDEMVSLANSLYSIAKVDAFHSGQDIDSDECEVVALEVTSA